MNKPEVYKNYNKIINSKYTSNDNLDKLITKNKANKDLNRIVEAEVERISKNLNYAEQVLQKYDVPQKMYDEFKAKQKRNSVQSRQQVLKDVAIKANDLLVSEGLNIPSNVFSYRNIEATAENLLRQSQMISKHEEINAINENYLSQGKAEIYTGKEWIWTGAGKTTRHASNDHQIRQVNEPFIIVNDETLDIDELMYPSDPTGSFSNTFICYCECQYLTGDETDLQKLGSLDLTNTNFKVNSPALKTPKFMNAKKFNEQFETPKPTILPPQHKENPPQNKGIEEVTEKPIKEEINPNELDYLEEFKQYLITEEDGIKLYNGEYYYKGLKIDFKYGEAGITKTDIILHNEQVKTNNATSNIEQVAELPKKEIIDITQLTYEEEFDAYIVTEYDGIKEYNGEYYYKGLKLDYYDLVSKSGFIDTREVYAHNREISNNVRKPFDEIKVDNSNHLSDKEAKKLHVLEVSKHYDAEFTGNIIDNGVRYSEFEQLVFDKNGNRNSFKVYVETDIITKNTYDKIPISQVLNEVYKVPENLRAETREIWFKNSEDNIIKTDEKGNYIPMKRNTFGTNYRYLPVENNLKSFDDAHHRIIINSNFFKSREDVNLRYYIDEDHVDLHNHWKHTISHEFMHSGDWSKKLWQTEQGSAHSDSEHYKLVHNAEPDFTEYANSKRSESMAEHGGYISCMEANPSLQKMTIKIHVKDENGRYKYEYINYEEYKERYPKHYKYFIRKIYDEGF